MSAVGAERQRSRGPFVELLKIEGKLALREPYGLFGGVALPAILLAVFGFISRQVPGNVGNSGRTVLDLYIPTIMVIAFIGIAVSLPNTLVRDREIGWLRRVSTTPVHPWRLLAVQLVLDLVFAVLAIAIILVGSVTIFGAHLDIGIPYLVLVVLLSIAEIFSLGLLVAALAPSQTAASAAAGVLFFVLIFLSGLWVQPAQISGPLQAIMYYSPTGAAARASLDAVFNQAPPLEAILTMVGYTAAFTAAAIRFFRWE
jgi:ABC-2 type transport system permease protein